MMNNNRGKYISHILHFFCNMCEKMHMYVVFLHATLSICMFVLYRGCDVMKCYVTLCYVMLCYFVICYVMLCDYVILCYVLLCYVMSYHVMSRPYIIHTIFRSSSPIPPRSISRLPPPRIYSHIPSHHITSPSYAHIPTLTSHQTHPLHNMIYDEDNEDEDNINNKNKTQTIYTGSYIARDVNGNPRIRTHTTQPPISPTIKQHAIIHVDDDDEQQQQQQQQYIQPSPASISTSRLAQFGDSSSDDEHEHEHEQEQQHTYTRPLSPHRRTLPITFNTKQTNEEEEEEQRILKHGAKHEQRYQQRVHTRYQIKHDDLHEIQKTPIWAREDEQKTQEMNNKITHSHQRHAITSPSSASTSTSQPTYNKFTNQITPTSASKKGTTSFTYQPNQSPQHMTSRSTKPVDIHVDTHRLTSPSSRPTTATSRPSTATIQHLLSPTSVSRQTPSSTRRSLSPSTSHVPLVVSDSDSDVDITLTKQKQRIIQALTSPTRQQIMAAKAKAWARGEESDDSEHDIGSKHDSKQKRKESPTRMKAATSPSRRQTLSSPSHRQTTASSPSLRTSSHKHRHTSPSHRTSSHTHSHHSITSDDDGVHEHDDDEREHIQSRRTSIASTVYARSNLTTPQRGTQQQQQQQHHVYEYGDADQTYDDRYQTHNDKIPYPPQQQQQSHQQHQYQPHQQQPQAQDEIEKNRYK